jgi:hypothetical protein
MNEKPMEKRVRPQRYKRIGPLYDAVTSDKTYSGKNIEDLVQMYMNKKGSEEERNALHAKIDKLEALVKNTRSSRRRANKQLNTAIIKKTTAAGDAMTVDQIHQLYLKWKTNGLVNGLTERRFRELIALDDWSTIAAFALPLLKQYGVPIVEYLWKRYVKGEDAALPFKLGDSGFPSLGIYPDQMPITTFPSVTGPTVSYNTPVDFDVMSTSKGSYSINAVNLEAVATILAPGSFKARLPRTNYNRTAESALITEVPITTNATGDFYFLCFCNAALAVGSYGSTGLIAAFAATNSSWTNTGTTPTATAWSCYNGPLAASATNVQSTVLTALKVEFIPTSSLLNRSGFTNAAYFQDYPNATFQSVQSTGTEPNLLVSDITSMMNAGTFQYKDCNQRLTMLHFPTDISSQQFNNSGTNLVTGTSSSLPSGFSDVMAITGGGWPTSTTVAKVVITSYFEYLPTAAYAAVNASDFPGMGSATIAFVNKLFNAVPAIFSMSSEEALCLASKIVQCGITDHDELYRYVVGTPELNSALMRGKHTAYSYGGGYQPSMYMQPTPTQSDHPSIRAKSQNRKPIDDEDAISIDTPSQRVDKPFKK